MKTPSQDPLAALFTQDAKAVDRQQLASLVASYLSIDQSSREFGILPAFSKLDGNMAKIEMVLAGVKARALYLGEPDGALPNEIIEMALMPEGSVKSSLAKLLKAHKIRQDKEGRYLIPSYRIPELLKQFINKE